MEPGLFLTSVVRIGPNHSARKPFLQSYFTQRALKHRWRKDTSKFNFSIQNPLFTPVFLNSIFAFFPPVLA